MLRRVQGALLALTLGIGLASAAAAQQRPSVAIMPTQYFSATAEDAEKITAALAEQFQQAGYNVVAAERSRTVFSELGYSLTTDIADPQILRFGRRIGADLVAHPQLMAVGIPLSQTSAASGQYRPEAVLYLRVLHSRTGRGLYTRQIGYEFDAERPPTGIFSLPQPAAMAAAAEVSQMYFQRVAGSRQELGRPARSR